MASVRKARATGQPQHNATTSGTGSRVVRHPAMKVLSGGSCRHAQAQRLWLKLARQGRELHLAARDDGVGSDAFTPGNGLSGMRERLKTVGGRVEVSTAPGQGFSIDIHLPLEASA